jgi:DNA polymerase I-like protein with 3'-5' exonuclease and polymerase domains
MQNNVAYTSYNLYNTTSRPTNAFNSVNYAAIPKAPEFRKAIIPQNDLFAEFDFDGYHLRLLCEQIGYELTDESAHMQLAKLYFGKDEIAQEDYVKAKQINFHAIYGKIPPEYALLEVFEKIQAYIDSLWKQFQSEGYVQDPISGKRFTSELKDMHPQKLMNYMMQSLETSRNILILKDLVMYLQDKNTKIALYTYDAIIFDFDKKEGKQVLEGIEKIMNQQGKYPVKFKYSNNLVL